MSAGREVTAIGRLPSVVSGVEQAQFAYSILIYSPSRRLTPGRLAD